MRVLLGVSGGIACYKVAHLVSRLVKLDIFDTGLGGHHLSPVEHIDWAKWAQIAVAAPLTACTLGKLANGIADNAFTTVWLALPASTPQVLCPAMNTRMWENAAVQRNVAWLAAQPQVTIVGPIFKRLADGDVGIGGLAEVPDLVAAIEEAAAQLGDQLP
jgi:phosphopantothenoylcysteine synthetase/decarboxylase